MIASVHGQVLTVRLDAVVVQVGGVGLLLQATPSTIAELRPGQDATLHTSLVVREDSLTLFGFADADERDTFEAVQTVSGIGPRLALAMLAVHTPDGLRTAVASQDLTSLMKVPGIGRKGAQRIVLELTDRLGAPVPLTGLALAPAGGAAVPAAGWRQQVTDALVGLGWQPRQAADALDAVAGTSDQPIDLAPGDGTAGPDIAFVLRAALRHLGRSA